MSTIVAIQGQDASFHAIAAKKFFNHSIDLLGKDTFNETFKSLHKDEAEFAVVAIENSLYGSINDVYDLLLGENLWIAGEVYIRIEQCLIGLPGTNLDEVTEVHSQSPALGQCEAYIDKYLPNAKRIEQHDTAASVAKIKEWGDKSKVAIGSREAAEKYGLEILKAEIETHKENYTRFVLLQKEKKVSKDADKSSLVLTTGHRAGALYNALGVFANRNINLTKLQSRPLIGQAWHYMFYVDVNVSAESQDLLASLRELKEQDCEVTLLGSYKSGFK